MCLFVICDNLTGVGEWNSCLDYIAEMKPSVICFAPQRSNPLLTDKVQTWAQVVGSGKTFDKIVFQGHGNIQNVGGFNSSMLATMTNEVKKEKGTEVLLLSCSTADEEKQLLENSKGEVGFQAQNLVGNLHKQANVTVTGYTVPLPFDPRAPLQWNPAQGEKVTKVSKE
ncbi:MAG: hypothetical protein AAFU80_00630 [Pseudomonadota bacterium]